MPNRQSNDIYSAYQQFEFDELNILYSQLLESVSNGKELVPQDIIDECEDYLIAMYLSGLMSTEQMSVFACRHANSALWRCCSAIRSRTSMQTLKDCGVQVFVGWTTLKGGRYNSLAQELQFTQKQVVSFHSDNASSCLGVPLVGNHMCGRDVHF